MSMSGRHFGILSSHHALRSEVTPSPEPGRFTPLDDEAVFDAVLRHLELDWA
jgi:hypothetical protein